MKAGESRKAGSSRYSNLAVKTPKGPAPVFEVPVHVSWWQRCKNFTSIVLDICSLGIVPLIRHYNKRSSKWQKASIETVLDFDDQEEVVSSFSQVGRSPIRGGGSQQSSLEEKGKMRFYQDGCTGVYRLPGITSLSLLLGSAFVGYCYFYVYLSEQAGGELSQEDRDFLQGSAYTIVDEYQHWMSLKAVCDVVTGPIILITIRGTYSLLSGYSFIKDCIRKWMGMGKHRNEVIKGIPPSGCLERVENLFYRWEHKPDGKLDSSVVILRIPMVIFFIESLLGLAKEVLQLEGKYNNSSYYREKTGGSGPLAGAVEELMIKSFAMKEAWENAEPNYFMANSIWFGIQLALEMWVHWRIKPKTEQSISKLEAIVRVREDSEAGVVWGNLPRGTSSFKCDNEAVFFSFPNRAQFKALLPRRSSQPSSSLTRFERRHSQHDLLAKNERRISFQERKPSLVITIPEENEIEEVTLLKSCV